MSFPTTPVNGQTTVTNNITYVYNSSGTGYWTRVYYTTSTLAGTQALLNIANTSSSTSTTTGALIVAGGVGVGGAVNIGQTSTILGAVIITTATIGNYAAASGSGASSTGTTSTFVILNNTQSTTTATGALQVRGGAGIGLNLNVGGTITAKQYFDSADVANFIVWPTNTSVITGLSAQGTEVTAGSASPAGAITVTRAPTAANTFTYYGLYNLNNSITAGIGLDNANLLWFGGVTGGTASKRSSMYFYSDTLGNVYANNSFRSDLHYAASNSSYYLTFAGNTTTNNTMMASGTSPDLIGYNLGWGPYFGGVNGKYIAAGAPLSSGPVWVSTGTAYTIIHSGNIGQYAAGAGSSFTTPVTVNFNNSGVTTATAHIALINPTGSNSGIYWEFGNVYSTRASIRVSTLGDMTFNSLSGNYYYQQDFGTSATNFSNSTTVFMAVDGAGNIVHPGTITATKLIDKTNANYFVGPSTTSTVNALTVAGQLLATYNSGTTGNLNQVIQASPAAGASYIVANRAGTASGQAGFGWGTGITGAAPQWTNYMPTGANFALYWDYNGTTQLTLNANSNSLQTSATGQMNSPVYYDISNSAFYVKPSGYSYLNAIQITGGTTGITTGTGVRIFQNGSSTLTSTLYWGNPVNTVAYNWQLDSTNNAALWSVSPASGTWTQALLVSPYGNLGVNQNVLPGDITMYGGISVNGTGTTQLSLQRAGYSGLSARISDIYLGDFSLYDKGTGGWTRAINASRGAIGVNTGSTSTYALTVGGNEFIYGTSYANAFANASNPSQSINFNGVTTLQTLNANAYGWNGTTSTGYGITANNTFESAAIVGGDHILGSGTMLDFFAFNAPNTAEYSNSGGAFASTTVLTGAFSGQNSMNFTPVYTLNLFQPAVRFTWTTFGLRAWDALLMSGNTRNIQLTATFETSINSGATWTTIADQLPFGATQPSGYNYLRFNGTNAGQYFRVTIKGVFSTSGINADIANLSLFGGYQQGQRLINWDYSRNLTTYGNLTTGIYYDNVNSAFFINARGTSTMYSATLTNDFTVAGRAVFGGWTNGTKDSVGGSVQIGSVAGQGQIYSYNNLTSAYQSLVISGLGISLNPILNKSVNIGGIWYDLDNPVYYVKPSTSSNIYGLTTNGPVQMVYPAGNNYNENLRLPRATDGYTQIAMATDTSGAGQTAGQWNLTVFPSAATGRFSIRSSALEALAITTDGAAAFNNVVYATRYYTTGGNYLYYLTPTGLSNLQQLNIDSRPALNVSPNDDYGTNALNTYTYVHASVGVDTILNLSDTVKLPYQSVVGSMNVTSNAPGGQNGYYTLYQARHRGGYSDGIQYGSQITIGMTGANAGIFFHRNQNAGTWQSWQEHIISGQNLRPYTIYASTYYDYTNPAYYLVPSGTSVLNTLQVSSFQAAVTGTPTALSPYLGSAQWVAPWFTTSGLYGTGVRNAYKSNAGAGGMYTFSAVQDANAPYTGANNYFAGAGVGAGLAGGAEIVFNYVNIDNSSKAGMAYFRVLRNSTTGWSAWQRLLNTWDDPYPSLMDQYVRTTDSPTFNGLTVTATTPNFNNLSVTSVSIKSGSNAAYYLMPWSGASYAGIGTFNQGSANQGFRFDQVNALNAQQSWASSANVSMYLGSNLVMYNSGAIAQHNTYYSLTSTAYYVQPSSTTWLADSGADKFTIRGTTIGSAAYWMTSAQNRGLADPSYVSGAASYGNVATVGTGLSGWSGYVSGSAVWAQSGATAVMFDSSNGGHFLVYATLGTGSAFPYMALNGSAISSAYGVYVTGSLYATGNVYAYSDRRKKRDIVTIDNALDKVLQLRGVYYHRIDPTSESDIDRRDLGVIAQEVIDVVPEAVKYAADVDEYSVNYPNLAGLFIEAIKDLKKELDSVKAELNMIKETK